VWSVRDPEGFEVVLDWEGWNHILRRHPYIGVGPQDIVAVVARPDERVPGREAGERWYYRRGLGPSAWIRVVVHYEHDRGLVVTAFPRRSFP
jgi:hypothetical protein